MFNNIRKSQDHLPKTFTNVTPNSIVVMMINKKYTQHEMKNHSQKDKNSFDMNINAEK